MASVEQWSGREVRALREARRMTIRELATVLGVTHRMVSKWEQGGAQIIPRPVNQAALDRVLDLADDDARARFTRFMDAVGAAAISEPVNRDPDGSQPPDDEGDAFELARRVAASDVGDETLLRLESCFDELATRYSLSPPGRLLPHVRRQIGFVTDLLDAPVRKTLDEHRRLLVVGAWLSLLAATLHIDLNQRTAGSARLRTAATLAIQAEHTELHAWTYETQAWDALTAGDYGQALQLSETAQRIAPPGSSAAIQATAQEGRAWARLGDRRETARTLRRVNNMVANLPRPDRPEHHYRYDPDKANAYTATTLAWAGDPAAEGYAREVITRLRAAEIRGGWPRRVAAAQIDLALALVAAGKHDEAAASALAAILSGRIVPSNHWRAAEVIHAIQIRGLPEATDLQAAYQALRNGELAPAHSAQ